MKTAIMLLAIAYALCWLGAYRGWGATDADAAPRGASLRGGGVFIHHGGGPGYGK